MSLQTDQSKMLFIEGLHLTCSAEGLKQLLEPFGTVLWSRLIVDTNGHSFSFGYVQMSTYSESLAAHCGAEWHHRPGEDHPRGRIDAHARRDADYR